MCRIFGISYGPENKREKMDTGEIATFLFGALVHGGPHAYGWMQWDGSEVTWEKHEGRADTEEAKKRTLYECGTYKVVDSEDGEVVVDTTRWMVGHVRFATTGSPKINLNNHPIPHGNYLGVHNGVLRNHARILDVTGREDKRTEVDSEAIFAAVNKWGHIKGLRRINGDMVAIYTDFRKPDRLRIARSSNRFLSIGWTQRGNMIFATEEQALLRLAPEIKFTKISQVRQNRLLVVKDGEIIDRRSYREPPEPERTTARPATFVGDRASRRGSYYFQQYAKNPVIPDSLADPEAILAGVDLFEIDGVYVSRSEFEEIMGEPPN